MACIYGQILEINQSVGASHMRILFCCMGSRVRTWLHVEHQALRRASPIPSDSSPAHTVVLLRYLSLFPTGFNAPM